MVKTINADFVVIGSGVAGSACVEELLSKKCKEQKVVMISASPNMKVASSYRHVGRLIKKVSLTEQNAFEYMKLRDDFFFIHEIVSSIDSSHRCVLTNKNLKIIYGKLIICSGSSPKLKFDHPSVYTLRDVDSVKRLEKMIENSRDVCIVGNGGIALELVYEVKKCIIYWVLKSDHIGSAFFDKQTSKFFDNLKNIKNKKKSEALFYEESREKYEYIGKYMETGSAVGPNWNQEVCLQGLNENAPSYPNNIKIYYNSKVKFIDSFEGKTRVYTEEGNIIYCDTVIMAIGVVPNTSFIFNSDNLNIEIGKRGGIVVDKNMKTTAENIYAAGDCAELYLKTSETTCKWFQMYLWSQAMHMGIHAANSVIDESSEIPIHFELFTHLTTFFGFKICLLGLYNLQGIEDKKTVSYYRHDDSLFLRVTILDGKIVGAVMIGETDMEETLENLMMSEIDVSAFGEDIINPEIDIGDYFD